MFCTNCGTKLEDNSRFCTNCGTAVGADSAQQNPTPAPKPRKKTLPFWILLIVLVAISIPSLIQIISNSRINPEYRDLLEQFDVEEESVLEGDTKAYLMNVDGRLMKVEFAYEGDTVTERALYVYYPFDEDVWTKEEILAQQQDTKTQKTIVRDDYYVIAVIDPDLDTEEGLRNYYGLGADEPVEMMKLSQMGHLTRENGFIPKY
jgi:hypothetical protein